MFTMFWRVKDANGYLSNWSPHSFYADGANGLVLFETAEHYMMYHKALLFGDLETADKILKTVHPRDVKRLGRLVKNYDDSVWSEKRFDVVLNGNILKFSQNPELLDDLKKYKNKIFVEASPYDTIWGIGLHYDDDRILNESLWCGQNLLGKVINRVIDILIKD